MPATSLQGVVPDARETTVAVPTPWWSWVLPGAVFVLFLMLFWPRPYAIPRSDALTYYDAARHLAEQGRYYSDIWERPAKPVTSHPPLFSILWAAGMRLGLPVTAALNLLQAMFLFVLGAAGGALAYRIQGSWRGPLIWTVLSCGWPGGANWLYWIRPMTEAGNAACFVVVCWAATAALRRAGHTAVWWLLGACLTAGLSMTLKGTGLFCYPVVGLVVLVVWRRQGLRRWWIPVAAGLLLCLPYALWMTRNILLVGQAETDKFTHSLSFTWFLLREPSQAVINWVFPAPWSIALADQVPPVMVVALFVAVPAVLSWRAWRRGLLEAAIPGAVAVTVAAVMCLLLTRIYTHEQRYWSTLLPCVALLVPAVRGPRSPLGRQLFRAVVAVLLLYCWVRFCTSRRTLWYATSWGFAIQQVSLMIAVVGAVFVVYSSLREVGRRVLRSGSGFLAAAACGILAMLTWRFANEARPWTVFWPLLLIGTLPAWRWGSIRATTGLRLAGIVALFGGTWLLGQWSRSDVPPRDCLTYDHRGVLLQVREDELRARQQVLGGRWPRRYSSNCHERFADLFEDDALIRPVNFPRLDRAAEGLPQIPAQEARVQREWLAGLRRRGLLEPFVMIYLPQVPQRNWSYGPESLEALDGLSVRWVHRDSQVHIAICQVLPLKTMAQGTPEGRRSTVGND